MSKETPAKQSKSSLAILLAIILLVLGGAAAGVVFALNGLSGSTGKSLNQIENPWLQNGTDAAFTFAMINRNKSLIEISDMALEVSSNETIRGFAQDLKNQAQEWNAQLEPLFKKHGVEVKLLQDTMSVNYSDLKDMKTRLSKLSGDEFNKLFVSQINIVTRMQMGNLQSDFSVTHDVDLRQIGQAIIDHNTSLGQQLSGWTNK